MTARAYKLAFLGSGHVYDSVGFFIDLGHQFKALPKLPLSLVTFFSEFLSSESLGASGGKRSPFLRLEVGLTC